MDTFEIIYGELDENPAPVLSRLVASLVSFHERAKSEPKFVYYAQTAARLADRIRPFCERGESYLKFDRIRDDEALAMRTRDLIALATAISQRYRAVEPEMHHHLLFALIGIERWAQDIHIHMYTEFGSIGVDLDEDSIVDVG